MFSKLYQISFVYCEKDDWYKRNPFVKVFINGGIRIQNCLLFGYNQIMKIAAFVEMVFGCIDV